jgi:hypothetical protein
MSAQRNERLTTKLPRLPAGVVYPRPAMIFDSVFPAALRGKACCVPLMVRHAGGMVAPAFCGQTCEPSNEPRLIRTLAGVAGVAYPEGVP